MFKYLYIDVAIIIMYLVVKQINKYNIKILYYLNSNI